MSFAKRINELGFQLECTEDPHFEEQMAIATADCSDLEKAEALNLLRFCTADGEPDIFDNFFRDHSIDIQHGRAARSLHRRRARHDAPLPGLPQRSCRRR